MQAPDRVSCRGLAGFRRSPSICQPSARLQTWQTEQQQPGHSKQRPTACASQRAWESYKLSGVPRQDGLGTLHRASYQTATQRAPRRGRPALAMLQDAPLDLDVDRLMADSMTRSDFEKDEDNLQIIYNNITQLDIPTRRRQAATETPDSKEHQQQPQPAPDNGVPVYVMLPLDTVWLLERDGRKYSVIKREAALGMALRTLHKAGVEGVMIDVWWGIVEHEPGKYDFSAYHRLLQKIADSGLKAQAVMSFHAAGGNVGDTCHITLPQWVLDVGQSNPNIFYTDKEGFRNRECLSLGCDKEPLFGGRTPIDIYRDFMAAFADIFQQMFGACITEVTVGMGPAGELRYPAYPEGDGRWRFPGVGEFQCYDAYMLADLSARANALGHPEWGLGGPHDSGTYNSSAWDTGFFASDGGNWESEYGRFFLSWYSGLLERHADLVLGAAAEALHGRGRSRSEGGGAVKQVLRRLLQREEELVYEFQPACMLGVKLAGVHWWHKSRSHAAELTAGYYNTHDRNGYAPLLAVLARHNARVSFTCVEMRDCEHPPEAHCSPQGLLQQVVETAAAAGVPLSGENALQRYDHYAFDRIAESAFGHQARAGCLESLTFLRMGDLMFDNWDAFSDFLRRMRMPPSDE